MQTPKTRSPNTENRPAPKHTDSQPAKLSPSQARAGKPVKGMRWVLGLSTLLAVIVLFFVVISYLG